MGKTNAGLFASAALAAASLTSPAAAQSEPVKIGIIDLRAESLTHSAHNVSIHYKEFTPEDAAAGRQMLPDGNDHGAYVATAVVQHYRTLDRKSPIEIYAANPFAMSKTDKGTSLRFDFKKAQEALAWMSQNGVRVVVTAFNSKNAIASHNFMNEADRLGMVVFAAYSNTATSGRVYPASDERTISVVDTKIGMIQGAQVQGAGRDKAAAQVGINFSMDGSVSGLNDSVKSTTGSSFASAKAAAYGAYMIQKWPNATIDDIRNAMVKTADTREVSTPEGKFVIPHIGSAKMGDRFVETVNSGSIPEDMTKRAHVTGKGPKPAAEALISTATLKIENSR